MLNSYKKTNQERELHLGICDKSSNAIETQLACIDRISKLFSQDNSSYFSLDRDDFHYDALRPLIRDYACQRRPKVRYNPTACRDWENAVREVYEKIRTDWNAIYVISEKCRKEHPKPEQKWDSFKCISLDTGDGRLKNARGLLARLYKKEQRFLAIALADHLKEEIDKKLDDIVVAKNINCEMNAFYWNCSLSVEPINQKDSGYKENVRWFYQKLNCPDHIGKQSEPEDPCTLSDKYQDNKSKSDDSQGNNELVFAYAVTPKESVQRIDTLQKSIDSLKAVLDVRKNDIGGAAQWSQEFEKITRHIRRQPTVVGFSNYALNEKHHIGWILGPKFSPSDDDIEFRHSPIQNALAALISVPSWWRTLQVKVTSCWIPTDSPVLENTVKGHESCDGAGSKEEREYTIRLPGTANDINRRFGYQISRTPSITRPEEQRKMLWDVCAEQEKVTILIEGSELWRSTAVTMGAQKAKRIEVLPNMKGILATFEKVEIPPGSDMKTDHGDFTTAPLTVWTSEGRTKGNYFARIFHTCQFPENTVKQLRKEPSNNRPKNNQQQYYYQFRVLR